LAEFQRGGAPLAARSQCRCAGMESRIARGKRRLQHLAGFHQVLQPLPRRAVQICLFHNCFLLSVLSSLKERLDFFIRFSVFSASVYQFLIVRSFFHKRCNPLRWCQVLPRVFRMIILCKRHISPSKSQFYCLLTYYHLSCPIKRSEDFFFNRIERELSYGILCYNLRKPTILFESSIPKTFENVKFVLSIT